MMPIALCEVPLAAMGATGEQNPVPEPEASHIILVVEDEVLLRMMFSDQLREAGYRVLEASDADEALDQLRHDTLNIAVGSVTLIQ
jgi:PleD family two-component response regulator